MELFSNPDSEFNNLASSTVATQIMECNNVVESLKKDALFDISKMQNDTSYGDLVYYREDEELGEAFIWENSELGGDFWQIIFNQLNS